MEILRRELPLLLPHELSLRRKKQRETTGNICGMIGKDVLAVRAAQYRLSIQERKLRTRRFTAY